MRNYNIFMTNARFKHKDRKMDSQSKGKKQERYPRSKIWGKQESTCNLSYANVVSGMQPSNNDKKGDEHDIKD